MSPEIGRIVLEATRISGDCGVNAPRELTMLGKALLNLDHVGRVLSPDFDSNAAIRANAADLLRRRVKKTLSPGNVLSTLLELKEFAARLPRRVNRILDTVSENATYRPERLSMERVEDAAFGPLDRLGQLALRLPDLEDTREKLSLYGRLGLTGGDEAVLEDRFVDRADLQDHRAVLFERDRRNHVHCVDIRKHPLIVRTDRSGLEVTREAFLRVAHRNEDAFALLRRSDGEGGRDRGLADATLSHDQDEL